MPFPILLAALPVAKATAVAAASEPLLPKLGLEILLIIGSSASLIWNIVQWWIKRKEDTEKVSAEKFKMLSTEVANQHNMHMESERERERLKGEVFGELKQLRKDVNTLEPLPGQVRGLESKFEVITNQMATVKEDVRDLKVDIKTNNTEMRAEMRSDKAEILAAIKNSTRH